MKIIKRITAMMLAICLILPCFSMVAKAAEGVIFFTDLSTKVGDTFDITGTVVSKGGTLKDVSVKMSYDAAYIRFISGDGVNVESDGEITFNGTGNSERLEFVMTFQALQEGSTRMEQNAATITTVDGEAVDCTNGFSDVTIEAGDPSLISDMGSGGTTTVDIDGGQYTISEAFSDNEIPAGFISGEITYDGNTYKGAVQEKSGLTLAYLVDVNQAGKFWVYNGEKGTFLPCEEILISDEYSIIPLDGRSEVKMPKQYEEGTIEINGSSFSIWYQPNRDGFYILYAVNNEGDKSLYLYDSLEHTYQRMETPKVVSEKEAATGVWSKISQFITDYLMWIVVVVGCIIIVLGIFLIVMAIKLHHRNVELDDLYDEYGIDEGHDNLPVAKTTNKIQPKTSYDDEFDDYYEDEDYYDEEDDELTDLREDFGAGKAKHNYDDYYDEEDFEEDDEEELTLKANKKKDDTFTMDFIDLD